jgi:hypothetical protein
MARYYVDDTSDPAIPEIKVWREGYQYPWIQPLTLAQAKAAVIDGYRSRIEYYRAMIAETRALRATDFPEE